MTQLSKHLYKTRKNLLEVCAEFDIEYDLDSLELSVEQCSSCNIWLKPKELHEDLDKNPICGDCLRFYGP